MSASPQDAAAATPTPTNQLTLDTVVRAVPKGLRRNVSQELVDKLNACVSDPVVTEQIKQNFLSYTGVMSDGKFKMDEYLNAVVYVSHKLMGMSNIDAYVKTFPDRYQRLMAAGSSREEIGAYVSAYNRGKLVNLILEQTMIPTWVLNQDLHQKALNTQAELMMYSKSDMVRTTAANSLLVHLARPKDVAPLINLNLEESAGMKELKGMLEQLATKQVSLIQSGVTTEEIAAQRLAAGGAIEGECMEIAE